MEIDLPESTAETFQERVDEVSEALESALEQIEDEYGCDIDAMCEAIDAYESGDTGMVEMVERVEEAFDDG